MRKILVYATLIAFILPSAAECQSKKDILRKAQNIQASEQYYWGIGTASTYEEADNHALGDLQSKIHVRVSSHTNVQISQAQQGQSVSSQGLSSTTIETSTGGVLTNTESVILAEGPEWRVMRFIERSKVDETFRQRVMRVKEYLHDGINSEKSGRIDNALRQYYWAYCLLRSLPEPEKPTTEINFKEVSLLRWIPEHLDHIFANLKIEAGTMEDSTLNLVAKYEDKNVTSLDFSYAFEESQPKRTVSFKDGIAQIVMPKDGNASKFQVSNEYKYEDRSKFQDCDALCNMITQFKDSWPNSSCDVAMGTKKEQKNVQKLFQQNVALVSEATHAVARVDDAACDRTVKAVLDAIRNRNYNSARDYFTTEGFDMFRQLISYGNARLMGTPNLHYYEGADGRTICRSIPMNFTFKNNHISFAEEVTLTMNPDGKIETLAFCIDNDTREAIFNSRAQWSDSVRMAIVTFLENYKTAYALKRLEFIRSIFDDYAIIVTGTVTMSAQRQDDSPLKLKQNVKYTKYNKEQYMERLEQQFKKNQFINLRFTDVGVKKVSNDDDFALRIKQDYFSSSYADTGYLFLMVDMNDTSRPLIKLRTWQPHRDPDINAHLPEKNAFYGLLYEGNFE